MLEDFLAQGAYFVEPQKIYNYMKSNRRMLVSEDKKVSLAGSRYIIEYCIQQYIARKSKKIEVLDRRKVRGVATKHGKIDHLVLDNGDIVESEFYIDASGQQGSFRYGFCINIALHTTCKPKVYILL